MSLSTLAPCYWRIIYIPSKHQLMLCLHCLLLDLSPINQITVSLQPSPFTFSMHTSTSTEQLHVWMVNLFIDISSSFPSKCFLNTWFVCNFNKGFSGSYSQACLKRQIVINFSCDNVVCFEIWKWSCFRSTQYIDLNARMAVPHEPRWFIFLGSKGTLFLPN